MNEKKKNGTHNQVKNYAKWNRKRHGQNIHFSCKRSLINTEKSLVKTNLLSL